MKNVITPQFFLSLSFHISIKADEYYLPVSIRVLLLFPVPLFLQVQQELKQKMTCYMRSVQYSWVKVTGSYNCRTYRFSGISWHKRKKWLICINNNNLLLLLNVLHLFYQFEKLIKVNRFICAEGLPPKNLVSFNCI